MLTLSSLEEVRSASIEAVVSSYIKLDKHNKAKCPFHNEKSSSFSVNPKLNIYKCFGCGRGGDVIRFVETMERSGFIETVEKIADICNLQLEYESHFNAEEYKKKREADRTVRQTMLWAIDQFSVQLQASEEAIQYLYSRGLTDDSIQRWNLGYAPEKWQFLTDQVIGKESPEAATQIGLIAAKEDTGRYYDRFRNRIIFPVLNEYGEPISLSGRTIAEVSKQNPKVLKGNVSPIYAAGKILYGLSHAREGIKKHGHAILVEGEMDVIQMHQRGADNTVGIGNNRMTLDQVLLLKRFCSSVILIPDMDIDKEGNRVVKGVTENLPLLLTHNFKVDLFSLPAPEDSKMDADDFAKQFKDQ